MTTKSLEAEDFGEFATSYWNIIQRSRSLSPEDKTRLLGRLEFLQSEMLELSEMKEINSSEYESNKSKRRNLERWVENILNAMIDIAKIILASQKKEIPKTYEAALSAFSTFAGLSKEDSEKLASLARLRNLLAQEYLDILFGKIQGFIRDFPKIYAKIDKPIEKYIGGKKMNLETKIEKADWKQWLPMYGLYKVKKDNREDKLTIIDNGMGTYELKYQAWLAMQTCSVIVAVSGIAGVAYQAYEKLF